MLWHTSNWDVLLLSFWPWPFYLKVKFRLNQIINIVNKYCPDRNFERLQTWNIYTGRLWWEESEWYPQFYFDLFFISRSILFWKIFLKSEQEYFSSYSLYTCTIYRWYKTTNSCQNCRPRDQRKKTSLMFWTSWTAGHHTWNKEQ